MRMKRSAKGRFAPPPLLDGRLQGLSEEVQSWPEIVAATHWHFSRNGEVDGADFYRGEEELGHIHMDGDVHIVTTPALATAMIAGGFTRQAPWLADDWVVFRIRADGDVAQAERLTRLAYDGLGGVPEAELIAALTRSVG